MNSKKILKIMIAGRIVLRSSSKKGDYNLIVPYTNPTVLLICVSIDCFELERNSIKLGLLIALVTNNISFISSIIILTLSNI